MNIHTRRMAVKVGTVPWGSCWVRGIRAIPEVGDIVWVKKTFGTCWWGNWPKCRIYEIVMDGEYLKVVYSDSDYGLNR